MQRVNKKTLQLRKIIGITITELRQKYTDKSSNKLANEYDIGNGSLSRIENGIVDCKVVTLWRIAEALGFKFSEFIQIIEEKLDKNFKIIDE